jgi:hypothetical protein
MTSRPSARKTASKAAGEVAVPIVDQEAGSDLRLLELPGQVPRLLGGPGCARLLAAGGEQDAPAGQLQEEQGVEALQADGIHREVVAGQDRPALSRQEATPGEPCSPRCGRHALAEQVSDAGRGDPMAEFEQLASDALVTPKRFSLASWSTSSRHSAGSSGRPGPRRRPNAAQRRWTSARCQPRMVAGCTRSRAPADRLRPRAARIRRSATSQRGRGAVRRRTSSSWRRTRGSRSRSAVGRPRRMRRSISRRRRA